MRDLKLSVRDTLQEDAEIQQLLECPDGEPQKIFYLVPPEPLPLPYIAIWLGSADTDASFDRNMNIQLITLNIAVWVSQNRDAFAPEHEEIIDRVVALFHMRNHGDTDDSAFFSRLNQIQADLFDEDGNAWGRIAQFDVHLRRTNVL